jgi:molybdopterin synthase catalytic subunit
VYSAITDGPIDSTALFQRVAGTGNGAIVSFFGMVREVNDGRPVTGIEYSAYRSMAERELAAIVEETASRIGSSDIAVEHRLGDLRVGECSVAIAVAHPHRDRAFEGARFVIEELKRRVPIWKQEHYTDGTREWVRNTTSGSSSELVDVGEQA